MTFARPLALFALVSLLAAPLFAQPLLPDYLESQNVRVAWRGDLDGGVDDEWAGFELAYAQKIHPLDQMVITYAHTSPEGAAHHDVILSLEEFYPVSETVSPYGVAGLGYRWTDFAEGVSGDSTGWFGKVGGGVLVHLNEWAGVYAEVTYHASDRDLWRDDEDADSQNVVGLLGLRFWY